MRVVEVAVSARHAAIEGRCRADRRADAKLLKSLNRKAGRKGSKYTRAQAAIDVALARVERGDRRRADAAAALVLAEEEEEKAEEADLEDQEKKKEFVEYLRDFQTASAYSLFGEDAKTGDIAGYLESARQSLEYMHTCKLEVPDRHSES